MCGISGLLSTHTTLPDDVLSSIAINMADTLAHRGPDDSGVWADASEGVAFSHRRLAIIDLSKHARQPMQSASGRYVLTYNGEIYNFRTLRKELDYPWISESDTEVILAAVEKWGVEGALKKLHGMFAFALWDKETRTLTLARDRMGEKPLYYGKLKDNFVFASELKAFKTLPDWSPTIDRDALALFMRYRYVPAPHSVYEGIYKLEPGHYVQIKAGEISNSQAYWSFMEEVVLAGAQHPFTDEKEAVDALESVLTRAIEQQMVSDVPLGAFLSGGIDSSTIVALMQAQSEQPIKTFTIGFNEEGYNEAPYAKAVAEHLGTEHTELYLSAEEAQNVIPLLPQLYDEPFADSSQIPTYLVSKMAGEHVKVALSGDAGDELFGGYNRHIHAPAFWNKLRLMPAPLRLLAARSGQAIPISLFHALFGKSQHVGDKLHKLFANMRCDSPEALYQSLCSAWQKSPTLGEKDANPCSYDPSFSYPEWMMQQDSLTYLPGDILTKIDRAAMGVSLETRVPLLDPEVMAFAWRVPLHMKVRDNKGKWILRQLLYRHVPKELVERPKSGFSIPLGDWLRGPLKEWTLDLLAEEHIRRQGFLDYAAVENALNIHMSGQRNMTDQLWNVLMFEAWLEN